MTSSSATGRPRLTILGTGYLGATHAVCMAELGFEVLGMDTDAGKVASLAAGVVPFHEPGLQELLQQNLATGRLRFTTSYAEVAEFGDVHFLCVGTPQKKGEYAADLTYVDAVVDGLGPLLTRPCLVAGKSTVPAGTAERLADRLAEIAPVGAAAELAWNPEFLREGFAVEDTLTPDRLVFGVRSEAAEVRLREAEVCEATGADVVTLSKSLSYDTRIGGRFLQAGLGFGGGCLPKDIRAFMARAGELGVDQALSFLREVDAINLRRRARTVDLARELLDGSLAGSRVAVLGAAFKPNSDDIRDSPALDVAATCQRQGAAVRVYDPAAMDNARRQHPELAYSPSATHALAQADVVLHLTEWAEFRDLDPTEVKAHVNQPNIVDGRNALDLLAWRAAGWTYRALGRP